METLPRVGDLVQVPRAFGSVTATITQVIGEGKRAQVVVEVPVHDAWAPRSEPKR